MPGRTLTDGRGLSHLSPGGLLDCYSSSPTFSLDWFCVGQSDVDVFLVYGMAAYPYSWGLTLLCINVVNRAESDIQVG